MARASRIVESPDSNSDEPQSTYIHQSSKRRQSKVQVTASIPSPVSPDKAPAMSETEDGGERIPMSAQGSYLLSESSCHKRPADHVIEENPRQRRRTFDPDGDNSDENYDPDQDIEERRVIRKGLRDLNKNLLENRSEYMNPNSSGLEDTITRANNLSRQVKQTSDATIDSHLLVTAADLTYKRTVAIVSGETGQGIDLDDLINRCKVFMRQGDEERTRLQTNRNERITRNRNEDGDEENEDEILNWGYLGRNACAQCIGRPCIPGFLLGPLSTEKKAKRTVVRKATLKISSIKESRPEVLREEDIVRDEDLNLSTMCQRITTQLEKVRGEAIAAAESETLDEMTDHEVEMLLDKYNLSREGGISLFNFVINPHSFGQSVENLFYVSFLIRDGKMAISLDSRGIPYLELRDDGEDNNRLDGPSKRYQAVLALDMASWKQLIEIFKINETIIPNREEPEVQNLGAKGWYA